MNPMGFKIDSNNTQNRVKTVIPPTDFQHVLCEGATGSGKTASLILPTFEDRLEKEHMIIFFDHKGHEHKKVKHLAQEAGRIKDVVEIGKPHASYINLMAELDTIRLKDMVKDQGMHRDPYWSNSAANLLEDIVGPLRRLHGIVNALKKYNLFEVRSHEMLKELNEFGIDIYIKPSFQTISRIVSSPKKLSQYKTILSCLPLEIEELLKDDFESEKSEITNRRQILAKILSFKVSLQASSRFTLSEEKSDVNSGNNAVLQHLDNTLASYAKKDYINIDEYTISDLMDSNAIVIIDTQSFGDDIMKLFLESILKKAVMRLRIGTHKPMSVFIDEANRVLFPSIDLHNDVLREASVELIIAIQNEEQMINKFSQTVWDSIKSNIKHKYFIDLQHKITYRDNNDSIFTEPMCIDGDELIDAEYAYHALEKNQSNIAKHFLSEADALPEKFTVIYDLDVFEHESSIYLEDKDGVQYLFSYHSEEIVKEVKNTYPEAEMFELPIEIYLLEEDEMGVDYDFPVYSLEDAMDLGGLFDEEEFWDEDDTIEF